LRGALVVPVVFLTVAICCPYIERFMQCRQETCNTAETPFAADGKVVSPRPWSRFCGLIDAFASICQQGIWPLSCQSKALELQVMEAMENCRFCLPVLIICA
jgi:hypothetical protein